MNKRKRRGKKASPKKQCEPVVCGFCQYIGEGEPNGK